MNQVEYYMAFSVWMHRNKSVDYTLKTGSKKYKKVSEFLMKPFLERSYLKNKGYFLFTWESIKLSKELNWNRTNIQK